MSRQNGLLILFWKDTFQHKIIEIVEDFDEKKLQQQRKCWKSSGILRMKPDFFIFSLFVICLHFFFFFHFFVFFSFLFFAFLSFSFFSFCHFSFFSSFFIFFFFFLLFTFFSFSFSLLEIRCFFFFGLNCFRISCDISFFSKKKKTFFEPSLGVPLWALFSFFFNFHMKKVSFLFSCISF